MSTAVLPSPLPLATPQAVSSLVGSHVAEPMMTACRPIIILGDVKRHGAPLQTGIAAAPFNFIQDDGGLRWSLATDDWLLTSPILPVGQMKGASAEAVLDVYVGLLAAFADAGHPADNTVRFTPAELMRRLRWSAGSARKAPIGPNYQQLELALDYLRHASIECEAIRAALEAIQGVRLLRANFSVLQSWTQTAASGAVGNAAPIEARFSDHFATLLRHHTGIVRYSAATFEALPRGVPRALFRYLESRKPGLDGPTLTVPAVTLLAHIGSRRRKLEPTRMQEMLDEPHNALYAHGVIGDMPAWSKDAAGRTQLTYVLDRAPDLQQLLRESAVAFGVKPSSAESWASREEQRFATVLAAAAQGIITPTRTIGSMVYNYMTSGRHIDPQALPHFEPGRGLLAPRQRSQEYEFLQEQYRDTRDWLASREEVAAALKRQLTCAGRVDWVTEGLMLLAARRMRGAEPLGLWRKKVGLR